MRQTSEYWLIFYESFSLKIWAPSTTYSYSSRQELSNDMLHYILCRKSSSFMNYLIFRLICNFQLQRVNLFTFNKINHHEAAIFPKTNLTNARMVRGERIDRFWWNLRYMLFLVSTFTYIWIARSEEYWDPFPFHRSWGLFWQFPWFALTVFPPVFHDILMPYGVIFHHFAYFVLMIAHCLKISSFYYITKAIFCSEIWHFSTIILHDLA